MIWESALCQQRLKGEGSVLLSLVGGSGPSTGMLGLGSLSNSLNHVSPRGRRIMADPLL